MSTTETTLAPALQAARPGIASFARQAVIALMAFLTVVDLFATQAVLPSLATAYGVSPAAMGLAVNASTIGMALAGLGVALFGRGLQPRTGIVTSLVILALPTASLAVAPDLATFAGLRVAQGLCMSTAFALTLAYLGEHGSAQGTASAFAAYITGNVASNLFGRLFAASLVDSLGLAANFHVFAALNLAGAVLAWFAVESLPRRAAPLDLRHPFESWRIHLRHPPLRAAFVIGFLILFAFIGTFTYVNFVLVRPPFGVGMMMLGLVYLVFLPSILTTPLAGRAVRRFGTRPTIWAGFGLAAAGLPLLLATELAGLLLGLALVGVGTFLAQATATGFVGRAAATERGAASGLYLASYFLGGLAGSAVLGLIFDRLGWPATVAGIAAALLAGAALAVRLRES